MSRICIALITLGLVCFCDDVQAGVIQNGDFSSSLSSWSTDPGMDLLSPTDGGGFALFEEDPDFSVQFAQTFTLPTNALSLSFDYKINAVGTFISGTKDSFQATLFTSDRSTLFSTNPGSPDLFPAFYSIDDAGPAPEFLDSNFVSVQSLALGFKRVTLDLTAIQTTFGNQPLSLDFLLSGNPDGITTSVILDNVVLNEQGVSTVPEPTSAAVWLTMLGAVVFIQRRRICQIQPS